VRLLGRTPQVPQVLRGEWWWAVTDGLSEAASLCGPPSPCPAKTYKGLSPIALRAAHLAKLGLYVTLFYFTSELLDRLGMLNCTQSLFVVFRLFGQVSRYKLLTSTPTPLSILHLQPHEIERPGTIH